MVGGRQGKKGKNGKNGKNGRQKQGRHKRLGKSRREKSKSAIQEEKKVASIRFSKSPWKKGKS